MKTSKNNFKSLEQSNSQKKKIKDIWTLKHYSITTKKKIKLSCQISNSFRIRIHKAETIQSYTLLVHTLIASIF